MEWPVFVSAKSSLLGALANLAVSLWVKVWSSLGLWNDWKTACKSSVVFLPGAAHGAFCVGESVLQLHSPIQ